MALSPRTTGRHRDPAHRHRNRKRAGRAPRPVHTAEPQALSRWEAWHKRRLPDDLFASYLRHDGSDSYGFGPAPFYWLLPVTYMRSEWKVQCGIAVGAPPGWWDGKLIPFARSGDGGHLFVDTRTGKTGEFFDEVGLTLKDSPARHSYLALLEATATSLETGHPVGGRRPTVRGGKLNWEQAK